MPELTGVADVVVVAGAGTGASGLCQSWGVADDLRPDETCTPCATVTDTTPTDDALTAALLDASQFLYLESGERFPGVCEVTVEPCVGGGCSCAPSTPVFVPGEGWPLDCGCGGAAPSCCGPVGITLGVAPVISVESVTLNSSSFDDWSLIGDVLVRTDGGRWPSCQDLADPSLSVTATWGAEPPSLGTRAARDLACMLIRADCGDSACAEPANVVRKQGGGMTVEVSSPLADVVSGLPQSTRLFLDAYGGFRSPPTMHRPSVGGRIRSRIGGGGRGCLGC